MAETSECLRRVQMKVALVVDVHYGAVMGAHDTITIEPTDEERRAARLLGDRVTPGRVRELFGGDAGGLADLVAHLTSRLLSDLAAGQNPVYASSGEDGVSPAKAAELLGISRQFLDRLLASGKIEYRRKPKSTHRLIPLSEIHRLQTERARRHVGVSQAIDALLDGGAEY